MSEEIKAADIPASSHSYRKCKTKNVNTKTITMAHEKANETFHETNSTTANEMTIPTETTAIKSEQTNSEQTTAKKISVISNSRNHISLMQFFCNGHLRL